MKKWKKIASDYNTPFWRNYTWTQAMFLQAELIDAPMFLSGTYAKGKEMKYIGQSGSWAKTYAILAKKAWAPC